MIAKDFHLKIATAGLEIEDQCSCHSKSSWYQLSHSTFRIFSLLLHIPYSATFLALFYQRFDPYSVSVCLDRLNSCLWYPHFIIHKTLQIFAFALFAKVIHISSRSHRIHYPSSHIDSAHIQTPFHIIISPIQHVLQSLYIENLSFNTFHFRITPNCIYYFHKFLLFISYPIRDLYLLECRHRSLISHDTS